MKNVFFLLLVCLSLQTIGAQSPLDVKSIKLDNGLTVWLNEDHTQTSVFGAVLVKAGSKDSPATGIAHYFEHIMFKGTDKIGTIDYESEKIYLDSIANQYDLLGQTTDDVKRKEIQMNINRLSIEAAKYAIPNEFDVLISKLGGSNLNAGTGHDQTVYHNTFVPQYIDQWLELYSERLLNPVFRLFQSELETVYEEKNMYNDVSFFVAFEKILERATKPHPYQYSIAGTTENLKNPSLSQMAKFYRDNYIASNMCLILSGDFDSEKVIPVIKEKFGRIATGAAPERPVYEIPPFNGKETETILLPIPVIKLSAMIWRGTKNGSEDINALNIISKLLSNSSGTGYLDLLGTDGKLLSANVENATFNETGLILALVMPKLVFQSYSKAEALVLNEINRIKKGDFSNEELERIKLEMKREFDMQLETSEKKGEMMLQVFSEGKEWNEFLNEMDEIAKLTKDDIIKIANKYFTDNYLYFTKKTGSYKLEKMKKPDFEPIVSPNKNERSEYAKKLIAEAERNSVVKPRTIDFKNDAKMVEITPLVTLYTKENPVNDVFRLTFNYRKGTLADNMVEFMSQYINDLPTDSLSFKELKSGLQSLGSTVDFGANEDAFTVNIKGFDKNIEPTLKLVSHFMKNVKSDKKALERVISSEKINETGNKKEPMSIANALFQYVAHGQNSYFLTKPTVKDIQKKGQEGLLEVYRDAISTECDIHYSGNMPIEKVKEFIVNYFEPNNITKKAEKPVERPLQKYEKPVVFVLDNPKAKQSFIYSYTFTPTTLDYDFLNNSKLFNAYLGGDMSSILFQEIREFRSFAYMVSSQYKRPGIINKDNGAYLMCYLSTQSDKTIDALSVLDSLLKEMPKRPENLINAKQSLQNDINNSYPSFRNISSNIAARKRLGYNEDANAILLNNLDKMNMETVFDFYNRNIKEKTTCYIITGNMKNIDMEKLKEYGEVKIVKIKDVFK